MKLVKYVKTVNFIDILDCSMVNVEIVQEKEKFGRLSKFQKLLDMNFIEEFWNYIETLQMFLITPCR